MSVNKRFATWRVDRALSRVLTGWSRAGIGDLIKSGGVRVNGEVVKKGSLVLKVGDTVTIDETIKQRTLSARDFARSVDEFAYTGKVSAVVPEDIPLDIIYEDDEVMVVDKPVGMVIHPAYANTSGTLANAIAGYFTQKGVKLIRRIGLVHRLDKDVSGLVVVAKNEKALRILSRQFSGEGFAPGETEAPLKARKIYWGVVGPVDELSLQKKGFGSLGSERKVEGYIWRSSQDRKKSEFRESKPMDPELSRRGKYALSYMKRVRRLEDKRHLFEIRIATGRNHQIRAQFSSMGLPLSGDVLYGGESLEGGVRLRCVSLEFILPRVYEGIFIKGFSGTVPSDGDTTFELADIETDDGKIERVTIEKYEVP